MSDWMKAFQDAAAEGTRIGAGMRALEAPGRTTIEYRLWWYHGSRRDLMGRWRQDERHYFGEQEGSASETARRHMANCQATWPDNKFVMEEVRVMARDNEGDSNE